MKSTREKRKNYTPAEVKWLRDNYNNFKFREMPDQLKKISGYDRDERAIQKKCYQLGLKDKKVLELKKQKYTSEINDFIVKNLNSMTHKEMAVKLGEKYGIKVNKHSLEEHCRRSGIRKDAKENEIGTIIVKGGKTFIKTDNKRVNRGTPTHNDKGNYMRLSRYLYRKHKGHIGDNEVVIHLDGDKDNFEINNLHKVDKATHCSMLSRGWRSSSAELTKTGVLACQLMQNLKNN